MTNPVRHYSRLATYLGETRVFAWGSMDCVLFALGAVEAQGGSVALPCSWTTERGAKRCLARMGGLEAAADSVLTEVPTSLARRGDIALVRAPDGTDLLMVVEGETLVGLDETGTRRLPRKRMAKSWSAI